MLCIHFSLLKVGSEAANIVSTSNIARALVMFGSNWDILADMLSLAFDLSTPANQVRISWLVVMHGMRSILTGIFTQFCQDAVKCQI